MEDAARTTTSPETNRTVCTDKPGCSHTRELRLCLLLSQSMRFLLLFVEGAFLGAKRKRLQARPQNGDLVYAPGYTDSRKSSVAMHRRGRWGGERSVEGDADCLLYGGVLA